MKKSFHLSVRAFFNSLEYLLAMQSNVAGRFDKCVVPCIDEGVVACLDKNNKYDFDMDIHIIDYCF